MLKIINLWSIGVPSLLIAHTLGCNKENVYFTLKVLRKRNIYSRYLQNFNQLGGDNIVVEIDESKIGKNKYHRGKSVKGFLCFGIVEKTIERRILFILIQKRDKATPLPIILRYISEKSIVYSDMWKVYHNLNIYFSNYHMVNHSKTFKNVYFL